MKMEKKVLSLICLLGLLAGCGVDEQTHQKTLADLSAAKQKLADTDTELEKASQAQTELESKETAAKAKITSLQSAQEDLKKRSEELTEKVSKLKSQEACVFQSAGATLDAQDVQGALQAYKDFVSKFPQSARIAKAKEIIAGIEKELAKSKK